MSGVVEENDIFDYAKDRNNFAKYLHCVNLQFNEARENFFTQTRAFQFTAEKGDYIVRACCLNDENNTAMNFGWATALLWREPQPVNAAAWFLDKANKNWILVALWNFSPGRDKTNFFSIEDYQGDVLDNIGYGQDEVNTEIVTFRDCDDSFNIGAGDTVVEKLNCPLLENISDEIMEQYNAYIPVTEISREDVCIAHSERYACRYCRH